MTWPTTLRSPVLFVLIIGLLFAGVIVALFVVPAPAPRIQAGEVESGWTQVGNGTRLQYLDLPDRVRCYRMRYSSNVSCVAVATQP